MSINDFKLKAVLQKAVSINDKNEYLEEAVIAGMWHPECPYCGVNTQDIEMDFVGEIDCEECEKSFYVEGV